MGRGVSYPSGALVAFDTFECDCGEGCDCWQYYRDGMAERAAAIWPSLTPCREWRGREDLAILENRFTYFGLSEYCGIVAIWLAPRGDVDGQAFPLCERWIRQAALKLPTLGTLQRLGTFSNGESVYRRKA